MIEKSEKMCEKVVKNLGDKIGEGGYGIIYSLKDNPNIVAKIEKFKETGNDISKCISGNGCINDILLEGLIMQKLNTLNCKHFIKFKALYYCKKNGYILLMERLNGSTYTDYIVNNKLSNKEKLTILFQITYALYKANEKMNFVHGDLIGKNIYIENVPEEEYEYIIDNKKIYISNSGIRVVLFDFGFSRLNFKEWKFYKKGTEDKELFNSTADICKIYANPNFQLESFKNTIIRNNTSIHDLIKSCKTTGWSYIPVAPFPEIKAIDILKSNLFDQLYKKISSYTPSSLKLKEDDIGIEPIYEGKISIQKWLDEDDDNIIVYTQKYDVPFCLKRKYFTIPEIRNIFVECIYENNNLLNVISYKGKDYINIGYYLGKKYIINREKLVKALRNKEKIFIISETPIESKYIVKESLLLSTIELQGELEYKNVDAYFDELYIESLYNYSYQWDSMINNYLLKGDEAFDSEFFRDNYTRYINENQQSVTKNEAIDNIKQRITNIDRCFSTFAPRNNINNLILYRGMKTEYIKGMKVGDSLEIKNYISTSNKNSVAYSFTNKKNCCMYIFELERGIPYINMISSTKYEQEKEILLPRGLIVTCTKKTKVNNMKTYTLHVTLKNKDQFTLPNSCYTFKNVKIQPYKKPVKKVKKVSKKVSKVTKKVSSSINLSSINLSSPKKVSKVSKKVKKASSINLSSPKKVSSPKKIKRCPKGSRRNKKTGNCDPVTQVNAPVPVVPVKVKRCPKGSRRNKKTGECDKIN